MLIRLFKNVGLIVVIALLSVSGSKFAAAQATNKVCVNPAAASIVPGGTWEKRAVMPVFRSEIAAAVLDDKIYVAGGLAGHSSIFSGITNIFEVYDPALDAWQEAAPLPKALHHVSLAGANGHIYMMGGYDSIDFQPNIASAWAFDPKANAWTPIAAMPAPRAAATLATIDDKIYLVGGVTANSTALWVYDPLADKWDTSRQPMPTAREHLTSAVIDGKLYAIGGETPNSNGTGNETYLRLATVEMYDPAKDVWVKLHDAPTPRSSITSAVLGGKIHVVSGENVQDNCVFANHEVYDPATDTWSSQADLSIPRHSAVSGVVGGKWYVIGGAGKPGFLTIASLSNAVEVFSPDAAP